jgi:protein-S-isoprenylcysteine O-methyltransferase Ste14
MRSVHLDLISGLWVIWLLYWLAAAWRAKPVARREPVGSRFLHIAPLVIAIWLFVGGRVPHGWLRARVLPPAPAWYWIGAVLVFAGLAWSVIARIYLGGNWSGTVTLKRGHELIRSGPYRWTRHPIYTGLLLALAGSAIATNEWRGVLGLALAAIAFMRKLTVEERFMAGQFPAEYAAYRASVPALIPWRFHRPPQ